jgi:hypothetical protein
VHFVLVYPQVFALEELETTQVTLKLPSVLVTLNVPRERALGGVGSTTQGAREGWAIVALHVSCQSTLAFVGAPTALAGVVALMLMSQHVRAQAIRIVGLVVANRAQQVLHLAIQRFWIGTSGKSRLCDSTPSWIS